MKIWRSEHVFDHPWDTVSAAVWRKYPNPHKPEIMGTDIVDRKVENGVLHSQRLIASCFGLPSWSRKLLGSDDICYGFEVSQVDPANKVLSTQTRNVTFSSTVTMDERMEYRPAPPSPDKPGVARTMLVQECFVTVHNIPFAAYLEETILRSISRNSFKGRIAMDYTIGKIVNERANGSSNGSAALQNCSSQQGIITGSMVGDMSDQAIKSVGQFSEKAIKSVDEFSGKAFKSVDEFSGKAIKSVDEFSDKAFKSVDEISEKALKSVDEISGKALKSVDTLLVKAIRSYSHDRIFDDLFSL